MSNFIITISALLPLIGTVAYIYEITKKGIRPNQTTWILYFVISLVNTLSLHNSDSISAIWISLTYLIQSGLVLIFSRGRCNAKWSNSDNILTLFVILGVTAWIYTSNPLWGLVGGILADIVAITPTLIGVLQENPWEESFVFWGIDAIASTLNLVAGSHTTINDIIFDVYLIIANITVAILVIYRRQRVKNDQQS